MQCAADEQVCQVDGTLGLVLPVSFDRAGLTSSLLHDSTPCHRGRFAYRSAPSGSRATCPNRTSSLFGQCLVPQNLDWQSGCLNQRLNMPLGPSGDGRVYNLVLRDPGGDVSRDTAGQQRIGAFYRLHGATCSAGDPAEQLGCLLAASPCSLGFASRAALNRTAAIGVGVNGVVATPATIRDGSYPLVQSVYVHTLLGAEELTAPAQAALFSCFDDRAVVDAAAQELGLVAPADGERCVDFDERQCAGPTLNRDNCMKGGNLCPSIDAYGAAPREVAVGSGIAVSGAASDADGPASRLSYLWSASAGGFDDRNAASTTYRCDVAGAQALTLTVWDGRCADTAQLGVTCVAP